MSTREMKNLRSGHLVVRRNWFPVLCSFIYGCERNLCLGSSHNQAATTGAAWRPWVSLVRDRWNTGVCLSVICSRLIEYWRMGWTIKAVLPQAQSRRDLRRGADGKGRRHRSFFISYARCLLYRLIGTQNGDYHLNAFPSAWGLDIDHQISDAITQKLLKGRAWCSSS